jgi:hypothetical protein
MPVSYDKVKGLKRPNSDTEFTTEQINEIKKCSKDIIYFAEKYFTVIEEKRGKHIIKLFDYQIETLLAFVEHRFIVLNFGRQLGKSTCLSIYMLWLAMFDVDKTVGILSNKEASAKSLMKDIKTAYLEMPDFLKPGAEKWDQTVIGFDNGSTIMGGTTAEDSFRGESLSLLALDEFAHVPQEIAENFFTSVFPTISTGGRMIMVSTPNGSTGKFYEIFTGAGKVINGITNPFVSKKVKWDRHPDRDQAWHDTTLAILGKVRFNQEHECSFTGSTNTLISGEALLRLAEQVSDAAYITEEGLHMWKQPQKGRLYAFGVDVSKGAGNNTDFSVINIFDVTEFNTTQCFEQVGIFRKNDIVLFDFIDVLFKLTPMFNNPMVIVENNTTGEVVCKVLYHDKEYENVFFDYERAEHGINANVKTKPMALNFFKDDVECGKIRIRSRDMYTELTYFEEVTPGVFKARVGRNLHDDTISSAYWVSYALRSRYYQDDFMYYAGKAAQTKENNPNAETDEDILKSFNKYVRPLSDKDIFKKQLGRI